MKERKGNINDCVLVRLTPHGETLWANYLKEVGLSLAQIAPHSTMPDGRIQFQLWELMAIFGHDMYMGNPNQAFVDNAIWWA